MKRMAMSWMFGTLTLVGAAIALGQSAPNVPDIAEREIQRRGNLVQVIGNGHRDDTQVAIAEAMRPPADDSHKWYISIITKQNCPYCNLRKGSDLSSVDSASGRIVPLFNPRTQIWAEHFRITGVRIVGLSAEGRTTVEFLQLNSFERLSERRELIAAGRIPPQD